MKRKLGLLSGALSLLLILTGCSGFSPEDATNFTQWSLDATYLGEFAEEYLEVFNTTTEAETDLYLEGIAMEIDYFIAMYTIEDATEDDIARLTEFYKELYSHSKFTVGASVEVPDTENTFALEVVIEPIMIFDKIDMVLLEEIEAMYMELDAEHEDSTLSEEALYEIYNTQYNEIIISTCEEQLEMGSVSHGEPMTTMAQVVIEETEDEFIFGLSDASMSIIDNSMIDYN